MAKLSILVLVSACALDPAESTDVQAVTGVTVNPSSINFGMTHYSAAEATPVVLTNNTGAELWITSVSIAGANASDFSYNGSGCPPYVDPGSTCEIYVLYSPRTVGISLATLSIVTSVGGANPGTITVPLQATYSPGVWVSPGSYAFGSVTIGAPETATLTITNTGDQTSTISVSIAGGTAFSVSSLSCPYANEIATGQSCTVDVTAHPSSVGTFSGDLVIGGTFAQSNGTGDIYAALSVTGIRPRVICHPPYCQ
jgi:hypothetical protein